MTLSKNISIFLYLSLVLTIIIALHKSSESVLTSYKTELTEVSQDVDILEETIAFIEKEQLLSAHRTITLHIIQTELDFQLQKEYNLYKNIEHIEMRLDSISFFNI
jgi:hypothetical protein